MAIGFRLAPVRRLLGNHLQVRIIVDDVVIALRADAGIGVGLLAHELDIVALFAHLLDEFLRAELRALIVVGNDLGDGDAGGVDLAVDEEGGMPASLAFCDRGDASRRRRHCRG